VPIIPSEGLETRRIIVIQLLKGNNPEVLLGLEGTYRTLPQVEIEGCQRIAPQLIAALKETCGIDAVSVSSIAAYPTESEHIAYELMEPYGPQEEAQRDKRWVAVNSLVESGFHDPRDFQAVRQAVAKSIASAEDTSYGPFARLGWFPDLQRWVQEEIETQGLHLTGRFRQLNACPTFSLIRFETDGPAVWFKAVSAPNQREYALTLALARSCSRFLPQVIAMRPDCNGWLVREAEGPLLCECSALGSWETAAADLAELQVCSLGKSLRLLESGARDVRTRALADLVEPFLQMMDEVMERQTKMPPPRLSRVQLRTLSTRVQYALSLLEETGLPKTLGHMDINPGNIVCSPGGTVFLDWAEAFVGHPFLTFEYLREHFRRTFGQDHPRQAQLLARYISPWRAFVSEANIRCALNVTPVVAVFACAVGNDLWRDPRRLQEPRTAGYLRSLTRRMEREANSLWERSLPCQN